MVIVCFDCLKVLCTNYMTVIMFKITITFLGRTECSF